MSELYLAHHGRLGQRWGKKNGPPYPLDFSKLSQEERQQAKQKSIDEGDTKTANKNRNYYTNEELKKVMDRFELNQKISSLSAQQIGKGEEKVKELTKKTETVANFVGSVAKASSSAIVVYNNVAKTANALGDGGKKLKTI